MTVLSDLASAILAAVEEEFATENVGLPDRRYIHSGLVALDCEQLVVAFERFHPGLPGLEDGGNVLCSWTRTPVFSVWLIRCVPVQTDSGRAPSVADLESAAAAGMQDATIVLDGVLAGWKNGDFGDCQSLRIDPLETVGPEGGLGGVVVRISTELT